jgi:hypothetical protein
VTDKAAYDMMALGIKSNFVGLATALLVATVGV